MNKVIPMNPYTRSFYSFSIGIFITFILMITVGLFVPFTDLTVLISLLISIFSTYIWFYRMRIVVDSEKLYYPKYYGLQRVSVSLVDIKKVLFLYKTRKNRTNFGIRSIKIVLEDKKYNFWFVEHYYKRRSIAMLIEHIKDINNDVHINKLMLQNIKLYKEN